MTRAYERLLRYAAIDTGSDETSAVTPSSPGQTVLAEKLAEELRELGVSDVYVDEHAYVYGRIPATAGYEPLPRGIYRPPGHQHGCLPRRGEAPGHRKL